MAQPAPTPINPQLKDYQRAAAQAMRQSGENDDPARFSQ
jgi:hypothetical protein